jgi:3',5'-cyclic AMP phosphodiesterase CpdA
MKIIATSDLHGKLPEIPPCDILIIAGDVCPVWDHTVRFQLDWLGGTFRQWLESIEANYIVGIAGNHDFVFEKWPDQVEELDLPWTYLLDEQQPFLNFGETGVTALKIYGTPWVPNLSYWAFHDDDAGLDARFAAIPENTDIVVSHGPPMGYCDLTVPKFGSVHAGFPGTNDMLERVKPKALICGHIHEGYGVAKHPSGATIYNVSHNTENYKPINDPLVVRLDGTVPDWIPPHGSY